MQDKFNLHKGDKVIYKGAFGLLSETISDVVEFQQNEYESYIVVYLEGYEGYVDFSDILTLGTVLSMFDIDTRYVYLLYIDNHGQQTNMGIFNTKEHAYSYAKEHLKGDEYHVERWEVK